MSVGSEAKPLVSDASFIDAYSGNVWAFICARRIMTRMGTLAWHTETRTASGRWEPAPGHPLDELLDYVNDRDDQFMLREATAAWLLLQGNAYWKLGRARTGGSPVTIHVLPATHVTIKKQDAPPYMAGFLYKPQKIGKAELYKLDEVVHIREFSPHDPYFGQGAVKPLESPINQFTYLADANEQFLRRGGVPPGYVTGGELDPDRRDRLQAWFDTLRRGITREGRIPVLSKDIEWHDIGKGLDQILAREMPEHLRETIAAGMGVPPATVGLYEYASYANSREQRRMLWTDTIVPLAMRIQSAINEQLAPLFDPNCRQVFETDHVPEMRQDALQQARADQIVINCGRNTINEVRAAAGEEPVAWGDIWWMPQNQTAVPSSPVPSAASRAMLAADDPADHRIAALPASAPASPYGSHVQPVPIAVNKPWPDSAGNLCAGWSKSVEARLAECYEALAQQCKRKVEEHGPRAEGYLRQSNVTSLLFGEADAVALLRDTVTPLLLTAYQDIGQEAMNLAAPGQRFNAASDASITTLKGCDRGLESAARTACGRLRSALLNGLSLGETQAALLARLDVWTATHSRGDAGHLGRDQIDRIYAAAVSEAHTQAEAGREQKMVATGAFAPLASA